MIESYKNDGYEVSVDSVVYQAISESEHECKHHYAIYLLTINKAHNSSIGAAYDEYYEKQNKDSK